MSLLDLSLPDVPTRNVIQCNVEFFFFKTSAHQRSMGGIPKDIAHSLHHRFRGNNLHKLINQHWNVSLCFHFPLHLYGIVLWHWDSYTFHTEYEQFQVKSLTCTPKIPSMNL
jgi:hypothetical protein